MTNIPDWMCEAESYTPQKDRVSFVSKSINSIVQVMSSFKRNNDTKKAKEANTSLRLLAMLIIIILTSVSRNFSFVLFMITIVIVRFAFMSGERIKTWIKTIVPVLFFSFLLLLPSLFLGNPRTLLTIVSKIFVCVSMVSAVNLTTDFNDITSALKRFHIPDVVIFIFDIAIKYIYILGEVCLNMLYGLKIRSIGKSKNKSTSASGILGTVFLKANEYATQTQKAMECRGFSGEYVVSRKKNSISKHDCVLLLLYAIIIVVFVYLEMLI